MKNYIVILCCMLLCVQLSSCSGCSSSSNQYNNSSYQKSTVREQQLKDAGLDNAARIEREARREYMKNPSKYQNAKTGENQVHYKGSKQQQNDLDEINRRLREDPNF